MRRLHIFVAIKKKALRRQYFPNCISVEGILPKGRGDPPYSKPHSYQPPELQHLQVSYFWLWSISLKALFSRRAAIRRGVHNFLIKLWWRKDPYWDCVLAAAGLGRIADSFLPCEKRDILCTISRVCC